MVEIITAPTYASKKARGSNGQNKLSAEDRPAHEWYRFVLSFPPHLVREYIERFSIDQTHLVLDPFCGTGTTLVECKKLGIPSAGVEANPVAAFASRVKVDWSIDPDGLIDHAMGIAHEVTKELRASRVDDNPGSLFQLSERAEKTLRTLPEEQQKLLLTNSLSPLPMHKTLVLLDAIRRKRDARFHDHECLALAKTVVYSASNLNFGPEVGLGVVKRDAPVVEPWLLAVENMANDLRSLRTRSKTPAAVYNEDSREMSVCISPRSVDAVITSPPYPNEKDYTRTTRLESVLLGFVRDKQELQALKRRLVRPVRKGEDEMRAKESWHQKRRATTLILETRAQVR